MQIEGRLRVRSNEIVNRSRTINFSYNDRNVEAYDGDTIASALYANGRRVFSRSLKYHRPRGLLCVSGKCPNCLMNVDGQPNVRTCTTLVKDGMEVKHQNAWPSPDTDFGVIVGKLASIFPVGFYYKTFIHPKWLWPQAQKFIRRIAGFGEVDRSLREYHGYEHVNKHTDIAIIGGGPAGLSSALEASRHGFGVVLIDDQPKLGGSLRFKTEFHIDSDRYSNLRGYELASRLEDEVSSRSNIEVLNDSTCIGFYEGNLLGITAGKKMIKLRTKKTIVCTGCFERPFIFANNDLPGIFLGSGLCRLVNLYGIKPGRRVLIATDNAYGYEVAVELLGAGLEVVALVEARKNSVCDENYLKKLQEKKVPILKSHLIVEARGGKSVKGVVVGEANKLGNVSQKSHKDFKCDLIALSVGFEANNSLLYQAGCKIKFDEKLGERIPYQMQLDVYSAGEVTGIHDIRINTLQGTLAGTQAALDLIDSGYSASKTVTSEPSVGLEKVRKTLLDNLQRITQLVERYRENTQTSLLITAAGGEGKRLACICEDVTEKDLKVAIDEGFDDIETLKRYSTFSMGPCQGKMCNLVSGGLCAQVNGKKLDDIGVTTSRPPYQPVAMGVLAGTPHIPVKLTPTHHKHLELNAKWMEVGEWKRPHHYYTVDEEYMAIRERVGIIDVSTLGRFDVKGRDTGKFLDFVFGHVYSNMKVGKARYAPVYAETGVILDDGVIARLDKNHYWITSSTGNADSAEQWMKWWIVQTGMCVHITNVTSGLAGINVAGPKARELLSNLVDTDLSSETFPYMTWKRAQVAGVSAQILRIGFVGEASWEIHFPAEYGEYLWDVLVDAGKEYGLKEVGVETMRVLSLEKRHFWPTLDTDSTSNALEADIGWAVKFDKPDFIGRHYLLQTKNRGLRQKIIGLAVVGPTIVTSGDIVVHEGKPVGRVTTARYSHAVKTCVGLAWVSIDIAQEGTFINIKHDDKIVEAKLISGAFYDPEGKRMRS